MAKKYKIVVYVPESHADKLRQAMGNAGAGIIGEYTHCMFTVRGISQFRPGPDSDPTIGEPKKLIEVAEERIETVCDDKALNNILAAIRDVHPYEEPATDVYPIEIV